MTTPKPNVKEAVESILVRGGTVVGAAAFGAIRLPQAPPAGMFVSLPPWAVARNVPWPEQARLAARVGYKGIDWAFGPAR